MRLARKIVPSSWQKRWEEFKMVNPSASRVIEWVTLLGSVVVAVFLIQAFVVKPYKIPSASMEPTLSIGQRVLVERIAFSPSVGQIVVFHPPKGADSSPVCVGKTTYTVMPGGAPCASPLPQEDMSTNFIKRIVAGPGDSLYVGEGHVYLKRPGEKGFTREKDSYIRPCPGEPECSFPTPITVPAGHWFMMGDNRGDSSDSRFWGPVPTSWIIGNAVITYWPLNRIGIL